MARRIIEVKKPDRPREPGQPPQLEGDQLGKALREALALKLLKPASPKKPDGTP